MADTGAPWNLPYAESSTALSAFPALNKSSMETVAAALTRVQDSRAPRVLHNTTVAVSGNLPTSSRTYSQLTTNFTEDTLCWVSLAGRASSGNGVEVKTRIYCGSAEVFSNSPALTDGRWLTVGAQGMIVVPSGAQTVYWALWQGTGSAGQSNFQPVNAGDSQNVLKVQLVAF